MPRWLRIVFPISVTVVGALLVPAATALIGLLMLGLGSRDGAPVTLEDGSYLKDDLGAILVSRLDSPDLKQFIGEVGGRYRQARLDDSDLKGLGLQPFKRWSHIGQIEPDRQPGRGNR